jgi:hypothetical protein
MRQAAHPSICGFAVNIATPKLVGVTVGVEVTSGVGVCVGVTGGVAVGVGVKAKVAQLTEGLYFPVSVLVVE